MRRNSKLEIIALVLSAGVLLTVAWPHTGSLIFLIFFAFTPLLYLEDVFEKKHASSRLIFLPVFLSFLTWNIGTTWFIFMIKLPGSSFWEEFISKITASGLAYVLNSIFMGIIFWFFHYTKRKLGARLGYLSLIVYWLSFEYLHMHWDINWPWLNLGNVFAENTWLIQWYEYTGAPGGSLWVLIINILIYKLWKRRNEQKNFKGMGLSLIRLTMWLIIPTIISVVIYNRHEEKGPIMKGIALQPNVDPYNEKFEIDPLDQLEEMLEIADSLMTDDVRLVVFPETALLENAQVYENDGKLIFNGMWEGNYENTFSIEAIRKLTKQNKKLTVIVGVSDKKAFDKNEDITYTARYVERLDLFYDSYNSLLAITDDKEVAYYRKSKLVPGVESVPFGGLMKKLEGFALDLGGTTGSLGTQERRSCFDVDGHKIGGMVCYESIYGEFVSGFVKNGAEALAISTNDSWWQETPGYKQLLAYARMRAIENRRSIIRSANTGISCFINQRGDIVNHTTWWTKTGLVGELQLNDEITFYSKVGDYISRIAALLAAILFLYTLTRKKESRL